MPAQTSVRVSARVKNFTYAIRNIVAEAKKVEAGGRPVRYLNIGDPIPFGFKTPPHLVEAITKAMRDGHNGYTPSAGIEPARAAVAAEYVNRGVPMSTDRVVLTSGTSEGIELALGALAEAGDEVLIPTPTYPLYTAVLAKIGARAVFYRTDPDRGWQPDLDDLKWPHHVRHPRHRGDRSEQSDRRGLPGRDPPRHHRSRRAHGCSNPGR